ncbi:hypothetical protein F6V30_13955 [Oryzomonas sagensis]|uniref:Uncharacterized protein n=1 Tax=Oryzomonas sagensis TaxID=2603857 RepID=A0ABQ6TKY1_9BACT|nr:hypothetical protein [Oryzomonas sagensis]KAB0668937.1 hypothetical protein F6V30_13955 [Oryzomonas sagensis]
MANYTVQDTKTGKNITFQWDGEAPPTDEDMAHIAGAGASQAEAPKVKPQPYNANETVDGVPKWGRDNPNLYAGAMTALDLLPMAASPLKATGLGMGVAGGLNAGAKYLQRKIADEPTTGGDVAGDFLKGATIEGGGRAVGGLLKAVTDIAPVKNALGGAANWLTRSAGKFGTGGGLTPTEQKAMADTVLKKGYNFDESNWQKMLDTIKGNTSKVDDIYAGGTRAGDTFPAQDVLARGDFGRLLNRGENVRGVAPDYTGRVHSVLGKFKQGAAGEPEKTIESAILGVDGRPASTTTIPAVPKPYTPTELNVAKRQLYQDISNSYKNHSINDATESAQKTLASAIKQTLDEKYPGAIPYNMDSSELLALEPYFARAINRISQRDIVGLGEKAMLAPIKSSVDSAPGAVGKMVAAVWDRPEIKSRVAQLLFKASQQGTKGPTRQALKKIGKVAAPAARAAFESALLTTNDPLGIR